MPTFLITSATSLKHWYHDTVGVFCSRFALKFCSRFALVPSLLAVACGDPLFASFAVGEHDDSAKKRDASSEPVHDAAGTERDPIDPETGGDDSAKGGQTTSGLTPDGCYILPDLSVPSNVDSGVVVAREALSQGCAMPDGGGVLSAGTTYARRDGMPMVKAGARYAFRWSTDTVLTRVRLLGGAESCDTETILFMEPGTATQGLNVVTCSDFTASASAQYLRLYGYGHDFASLQLLAGNGAFALCPGSCPANTKLLVDAGGPKGKASDAGVAP